MEVQDLIFYILDAVIFVMLIRMRIASNKIEIKTKLGPRWVIPAVFWAIALVGVFHYSGIFLWIQTTALVVMGIIYYFMDSGLSPEGIVMIGRLYPYKKLKVIQVDEEHAVVNFAQSGGTAPISFQPEQMKDVRKYLSKYAGIPLKDVRSR